jgi:hypothetical protein
MNSSDLLSVLSSVCQQIHAAYGLESFIPSSPHELVTKFQGLMFETRNDKPLFVFLDSLDQFRGTLLNISVLRLFLKIYSG